MDPDTLRHYDSNIKDDPGVVSGKEERAEIHKRFMETLQRVNIEVYAHRLIKMLDESADVARFTIPFVGITIDRNWFGYINVIAGMFFYLILLAAMENQIVLLTFVRKQAAGCLPRLHMINVTQVFSGSGLFPQRSIQGLSGLDMYVRWVLAAFALAMRLLIVIAPLFVALAVEWDALAFARPCEIVSPYEFFQQRALGDAAPPNYPGFCKDGRDNRREDQKLQEKLQCSTFLSW
jgi:hypothetical protein